MLPRPVVGNTSTQCGIWCSWSINRVLPDWTPCVQFRHVPDHSSLYVSFDGANLDFIWKFWVKTQKANLASPCDYNRLHLKHRSTQTVTPPPKKMIIIIIIIIIIKISTSQKESCIIIPSVIRNEMPAEWINWFELGGDHCMYFLGKKTNQPATHPTLATIKWCTFCRRSEYNSCSLSCIRMNWKHITYLVWRLNVKRLAEENKLPYPLPSRVHRTVQHLNCQNAFRFQMSIPSFVCFSSASVFQETRGKPRFMFPSEMLYARHCVQGAKLNVFFSCFSDGWQS